MSIKSKNPGPAMSACRQSFYLWMLVPNVTLMDPAGGHGCCLVVCAPPLMFSHDLETPAKLSGCSGGDAVPAQTPQMLLLLIVLDGCQSSKESARVEETCLWPPAAKPPQIGVLAKCLSFLPACPVYSTGEICCCVHE